MPPNDLQPDDLKKLLKLKQALSSDPEFTKDDVQTALDEATRQLRAQRDSLMGRFIKPAAAEYKNKIAPMLTKGVAQGMHTGGLAALGPVGALMAGKSPQGGPPGPVANFAAQQTVPQDLTSAGIDAAMLATQMGPVAKAFRGLPAFVRLLGEYGAPAAVGGALAPLEGRSRAEGEFQGASQVGMGKVLGGALNLLGATTSKTDADRVTADVGAYMKKTMPDYQGPLKTVRDWAYAFARKGSKNAKVQLGNVLSKTQQQLSKELGTTKLTIPTLKDALVELGADPTDTPESFTFDQAMNFYRKIRNKAYSSTGAGKEGADFAKMRQLRSMMHSARGEMIDEMELAKPGTGSMWDSMLRQDAAAHVYSNLMHDLQKAGISEGKLPVRDLQLLLSNGGEGGYAEDLDNIFGDPNITDGLIISSQRDALPYQGVDEKTLREGLRVYGNPADPTGLHFGISPHMLRPARTVGAVTRRFPKMPGALPGVLTQNLGKSIGSIEAPDEEIPVDTGGTQ